MLRAACLAVAFAGTAAAQEPPRPSMESAILTVVPDRLLADTQAGRAIAERFDSATRALVAENRSIEAALEAEERDLTARRAVTPPEEFARIAQEFDQRVDGIRDRQDAKSRDLTRRRDSERQAFLQATVPILAAMMEESGAVAILDRGSVFLSFDLIDVTDQAVRRMDAELGDGSRILDAAPPTESP
ncbi:OmpH family outer membrane protein [Falsirhodobacter xinxiangensis]|uniref:OmpH family outer membrane protein n=1 Tax=Falsirhodobacter xinxiangensis TaxID=2530049 RepID=UPI0010AA34DB|nr:OmpH family outer membrane protein [Rhodobacter xinxiangensis]